jgi:hypothetical protein
MVGRLPANEAIREGPMNTDDGAINSCFEVGSKCRSIFKALGT